MGALAEFERSLISERTKAGLDAARIRGRQLGRRRKLSTAEVRAAAQRLLDGSRLRDLAERLRVSPMTLRRALLRINGA